MGEISEKLKGLKFMQRAEKKSGGGREESFSTYFCKRGVFSYGNKQKMDSGEDEAQKKARN